MISWLVRFEAFPEHFTQSLTGYSSLLSRDVLVMDSWMKIIMDGSPVGYTYTNMDINESDPMEYYVINNRVSLKLKLMGETQRLYVNASSSLDITYQLQKFSFTLLSHGYKIGVEARRVGEETFDVEIKTGDIIQRRKIDIPGDVVLYSPMTDMAMKRLKPGQQLSIQTLDPATLSRVNIVVRALRKEQIDLHGDEYDTTVISTEYRGMNFLSWLDSDGRVLRQETPFGWIMESCTPEEAFEALEMQ